MGIIIWKNLAVFLSTAVTQMYTRSSVIGTDSRCCQWARNFTVK